MISLSCYHSDNTLTEWAFNVLLAGNGNTQAMEDVVKEWRGTLFLDIDRQKSRVEFENDEDATTFLLRWA